MNRLFTAIVTQSAVAAAVLVAAPFAFAAPASHNSETGFEAQVAAAPVASTSRAVVQQGAMQAARQHLNSETGLSQAERQPVSSTAARASVRAEAVEAVRTGRVGGYSAQNGITPTL